MDSGLYAAYTALLSRQQALDTAANNLANAGTNGFRAQRDVFRAVLTDSLAGQEASQVGGAVNRFGVLGGCRMDLAQGPIATTGNPLDLALDGAGFFAVKTAHGVRYTRDGSFTRLADGTLAQGNDAVLGVDGKPVVMPSGLLEVSADGTVSVGGAVAGTVGVFRFSGPTALKAEGTNRFVASEAPVTGAAGAGEAASVRQGALEGANQDAVHGTMQLVLVQRQAEMMQRALSVFHNDFDKTASEELGRV